MGMTAFYIDDPAAHEAEALRTIDRALELGINFFDTVRGAPPGAPANDAHYVTRGRLPRVPARRIAHCYRPPASTACMAPLTRAPCFGVSARLDKASAHVA
jgi:hypothetical protein